MAFEPWWHDRIRCVIDTCSRTKAKRSLPRGHQRVYGEAKILCEVKKSGIILVCVKLIKPFSEPWLSKTGRICRDSGFSFDLSPVWMLHRTLELSDWTSVLISSVLCLKPRQKLFVLSIDWRSEVTGSSQPEQVAPGTDLETHLTDRVVVLLTCALLLFHME